MECIVTNTDALLRGGITSGIVNGAAESFYQNIKTRYVVMYLVVSLIPVYSGID